MLYADTAQLFSATVLFIEEGLARGERCVLLAHGRLAHRLAEACQAASPPASRQRAGGELVPLRLEDCLSAGAFSAEALLALLRQHLDQAIASGLAGLRVAAELSSLLRAAPGPAELRRYEALASRSLFAGQPTRGLCLYDLGQADAAAKLLALRCHPRVVLSGQALRNPYAEPPALLAEEASDEQRVAWMLGQLQAAVAGPGNGEPSADDVTRQPGVAGAPPDAQHLEQALEAAGIGTWEWDIPTGRVRWSANLEGIHGLARGSFDGTFESFMHGVLPEDRAQVQAALTRALEDDSDYQVSYRTRGPDGAVRWLEACGRVVARQDGQPTRMCGICRDTTARHQAEDARDRLAAIVASSDDAIIGKTLDGLITSWNAGAQRLYGYTPEEVIGRPVSILVPRERPDELPAILRRLRRGEHIEHFETVRVTKDGRRLDVSLSVSPVRDAGGSVVGAAKIARDITQRKRAERQQRFLARASELLASSLDYETTLRSIAELVVPEMADWCAVDMLTEDGRIDRLAATRASPRKMEWASDAGRGYPIDPEALHGLARVLRTGRAAFYPTIEEADLATVARDAAHLEALRQAGIRSAIISPLVARGRTIGALTFVTAESGRRYDEQDLALAEDLARRSALAIDHARLYRDLEQAVRLRDEFLAVVSHDLKNPLTSIKGYTQLLRRQAAKRGREGERLVTGLAKIESSATRMTALINELVDVAQLEMGQPLRLELRPTELRGLLDRLIAEYQQTSEQHRLRLETNVPRLEGLWDPTRLERVLDNLLNNAVKYSPDGGEIIVRLARQGQTALVEVQDHGLGIPAQDLPRIFQRFQRASNVVGRVAGTGIGLAGSKMIVEQHGGTIAMESQEGRGTLVRLSLPLKNQP